MYTHTKLMFSRISVCVCMYAYMCMHVCGCYVCACVHVICMYAVVDACMPMIMGLCICSSMGMRA